MCNIIAIFAKSNKDKEFYYLIFKKCNMKTNELKRLLKRGGCHCLRKGAEHDIWINPLTGRTAAVPRHDAREVRPGTLKSILNALLG